MAKSFLKLVGLLSVVMAVFLLSPVKAVKASANDNIRGLAYNSLYGYISFNCLDDDFAGRFPFTFPFTFNIPPCSINHGVNLDDNNNFSGDAWNLFLGNITFTSASSTPDGGAYKSNCDSTEARLASSTACYDENYRMVYGYMRIVSTGEWIRLDTGPSAVTITKYSDPQPGIFSGYASSTFGSISFNCTDDGSCATNNYDVKIGPLQIRQMTAPNWGTSDACLSGAMQAVLKWNRRSGTQTAFQVIVSSANSTSTGVVYDSGKVNTTAIQQPFTPRAYNTSYYWFLRLWDEIDVPTNWRQFNVNFTKDWITDNFNQNSAISPNPKLTFTSYSHEFPRSYFTWTPDQMLVATTSNSFINSSIHYITNNPQSCDSATCSFAWSTGDVGATILNPSSASTSILFKKATNTLVTLITSDKVEPALYNCSTSTVLNVNYALPLWKEIKASQ